ncbi:MAG: major outer membrane protein [Wolinella sp.]
MKHLKASLVLAFSLCGVANISLASSLQEEIEDVDMSIFLRYRYTGTHMKNQDFGASHLKGSSADSSHAWRANADFKSPNLEGIELNLGIVYNNSSIQANRGNVYPNVGQGLGAGEDSAFGVSTFFATLHLEAMSTVVHLGKMRLDTPLNDTLDDRGTGIYAFNSDIPHWTFKGGAFDTWSLGDLGKDYDFGATGSNSITKELIAVGANADYESISAQLWYFRAGGLVDHALFAELAYENELFALKGQSAISSLDKKGELLNGVPSGNLLYTFEAQARVAEQKTRLKVGYIGSGEKGYRVSLDNQASFNMGGKIWNDHSIAEVNYSIYGAFPRAQNRLDSLKLSVFYVGVDHEMEEGLYAGIDYVRGENKKALYTINFQEITPMITYKYNKNVDFLAYYAMLKAENTELKKSLTTYKDAHQSRFKFQVTYHF